MKQITLKAPFSVHGKGLHTGMVIDAEFLPAPDNHGYKIQRTDLEGEPILDALAENVVSTARGTVIARGEVSVSTIEHAMAALYAAGVDNVLIRINGPEMPILDGSAQEFCDKIDEVGLETQKADKDYYIVKQKIEVHDENTGASIVVLPDADFSVDVMVQYDSPVLSNHWIRWMNSARKSPVVVHSFLCVRLSRLLRLILSRAVTWKMPWLSTTARCRKQNLTVLPT